MKIRPVTTLKVLGAFLTTALLISCKKESSTELFPVRFAVLSPGIGTAYLEFAKDHKIFAKRGIDLQLNYFLNGGNEGNAAIASGQIDAGSYGPPVLTAIVRGLKIKIISATTDTINTGSVLAGKPEIKSVEDLRGKVVATSIKGQSPYQHTFTILEAHGLTAKDVKLRPTNGASLQLLKSGQVDATTLGELDLAIAQKGGFAHPLDTSGKYLGAYQSSFIFASDNLLKNHYDKAQGVKESVIEASKFALDSFPAYYEYVRTKYGQKYDSTELKSYLLKTLTQNKKFTIYPHAVRNYLQLMVKWEDFTQSEVDALTDEKLFDNRFVQLTK